MTSPSQEQIKEVFGALVGNGLDFFERSANELDKEQKFSIVHFATGLELLLKARLFHEHWTLIASDPHTCAWTSIKDGTVGTLQASDLCSVITTTTGTPLNYERQAFKVIFDHRNRVLHWAPNGDLASTVAEQCLAWYRLSALLKGQWRTTFSSFEERIEEVERRLHTHRTYLAVKFRQIEPTLHGPEKEQRLLLCPACDFKAGVVSDGTLRVPQFECRVCGYPAAAVRLSCGALIPLEALPIDDCACGENHDREQIINELNPTPLLKPKEMSIYEPDRGYCGECFDPEETVAADGDMYVCVGCGARFEPEDSSRCECCSQQWFGWDAEDSYFKGCDQCDGIDLHKD
jgi:hypothetical protein